MQILSVNTEVRNACLTGNLTVAQQLFAQQTDADGNNHNSYAYRSFIMAQKCDWDHALLDALRVRYDVRLKTG